MERVNCNESEIWENEEKILQLRHWASLRGQTLSRTGQLSLFLHSQFLIFPAFPLAYVLYDEIYLSCSKRNDVL